MSAQAVGALGAGTEPPPDRTLPSLSEVILVVSLSMPPRSAWVIWPIFSSRSIRPSRSETRWLVESDGSWYGSTSDAEAVVVADAGVYSGRVPTATAIEARRTAARRPDRPATWPMMSALPAALTRRVTTGHTVEPRY